MVIAFLPSEVIKKRPLIHVYTGATESDEHSALHETFVEVPTVTVSLGITLEEYDREL